MKTHLKPMSLRIETHPEQHRPWDGAEPTAEGGGCSPSFFPIGKNGGEVGQGPFRLCSAGDELGAPIIGCESENKKWGSEI